jgi:PKD repeat protein
VCLTATDTCGAQTYCDSITTTCTGAALFGHQQVAARTVSFFNQSVGTGTLQYLWDFGDGTTSTQASPSHMYATEGTYWACLQTTDTCGTFTFCDSIEVVCFNLVSDYSFTQNNLTATFINQSTGAAPLNYYWTFGDGGFSFTQNPVYTYQNEGTYQVCLQTTDPCGTRTTCYTLEMCLLPLADFSAQNTTGFTFKFVPATGNALSYIWNFGDGNFSSAPSPTYTYQNPGLYNVCMSLVDDCGDADTCISVLASLFDIDENGHAMAPVIYPNPAKDFLNVAGLPQNQVYTFELTNIIGQAVLSGKLEDEQPISVQSLAAGLYTIRITSAEGFDWKGKVVVE